MISQKSMLDVFESSKSLLEAGQPEQALVLAEEARSGWPDALLPRLAVARCLTALNQDHQAEIDAWRYCIDNFPDQVQTNWFDRLRAAVEKQLGDFWYQKDPAAAIAEIERIHAQARCVWPEDWCDQPDGTEAENHKRDQALKVSEWIALARARISLRLEKDPQLLPLWEDYFSRFQDQAPLWAYLAYLDVIRRCDTENSSERTRVLIEQAEQRWPEKLMHEAESETNPAAQREQSAMLRLGLAKWFLTIRQTEDAKQMLDKIPRDLPQNRVKQEMAQVAESFSMLTTYNDLVGPDPGNTEISTIQPWFCSTETDTVIFVFNGGGEQVTLALSALHLELRKLGRHLVYISDLNESFYLTGRDWRDPDELCQKLHALAAELGADRYYMLGFSSGGYGALRYGAAMNAEAVLALSPVTVPEKLNSAWIREPLLDLRGSKADFVPDLDEYLASLPVVPRCTIWYGADCEKDKVAAEALAGFPTVELAPIDGLATHSSLNWFIRKRQLGRLLEGFLDEMP
ncbi:alpha/beta fold hydrolase [Rhodovibrionaceae bacterium A322]